MHQFTPRVDTLGVMLPRKFLYPSAEARTATLRFDKLSNLKIQHSAYHLYSPLTLRLTALSSPDSPDVCLRCSQSDQSLVAGIGDADNSLSMRWGKLGSCGAMNQAAGGGGACEYD